MPRGVSTSGSPLSSRASTPPPQKLVRLLELACLVGADSGSEVWDDWILWVEFWARALRDTDLASQREVLDRRWFDTICRIVTEGRATGDFRRGDPEVLSRLFAGLIDGLALQVLLRDPGVPAASAFELCVGLGSRELDCDLESHLQSRDSQAEKHRRSRRGGAPSRDALVQRETSEGAAHGSTNAPRQERRARNQ